MKYFREKKVRFGDGFLDVDLFEMSDDWEPPAKRAKRKRVSPPHIIAANDRHSKNHLRQIIVHNFGAGDIYVTPTYGGEPPDLATARQEMQNYIRRLNRIYTKNNIELRAIWVTEGGRKKSDGTFTRVHHHLIINAGVSREDIEAAWRGKSRGKDYTRGFCNAVMITPGEGERGCERIAEYMAKSRTKNLGKGLRRWSSTRNIRRPTETIIDNKISRRRTAELTEEAAKLAELIAAKKAVREEDTEELRRILSNRYGREVLDVLASVNSFNNRVYISARFRQKE